MRLSYVKDFPHPSIFKPGKIFIRHKQFSISRQKPNSTTGDVSNFSRDILLKGLNNSPQPSYFFPYIILGRWVSRSFSGRSDFRWITRNDLPRKIRRGEARAGYVGQGYSTKIGLPGTHSYDLIRKQLTVVWVVNVEESRPPGKVSGAKYPFRGLSSCNGGTGALRPLLKYQNKCLKSDMRHLF